MNNATNNEDPTSGAVTNRTMNIAVALILMAVSMVVLIASYRLGSGWKEDVGPDSGYFPFYVSLFMFLASSVTMLQHVMVRRPDGEGSFVAHHELKMVFRVLIPMTIFVVVSVYIGIYISMIFFIGYFMVWIGKYSLIKTIPVVLAVPIILFVVFEIWFLVPLPKGPFEAWLGY
ncbi:MAG: tripartite tricarboxylate transporter TctB family protein [Pseudolabrys sp.]|nr:tripartite tricarboxylate transporter TctB family protein [Pseudolabrys sp.]